MFSDSDDERFDPSVFTRNETPPTPVTDAIAVVARPAQTAASSAAPAVTAPSNVVVTPATGAATTTTSTSQAAGGITSFGSLNRNMGWEDVPPGTFKGVRAADGYIYRVMITKTNNTHVQATFEHNGARRQVAKHQLVDDIAVPRLLAPLQIVVPNQGGSGAQVTTRPVTAPSVTAPAVTTARPPLATITSRSNLPAGLGRGTFGPAAAQIVTGQPTSTNTQNQPPSQGLGTAGPSTGQANTGFPNVTTVSSAPVPPHQPFYAGPGPSQDPTQTEFGRLAGLLTSAITNIADSNQSTHDQNNQFMQTMTTILNNQQQGTDTANTTAAALKDALEAFKTSNEESDKTPGKAKEVDTFETRIDGGVDDMQYQLSLARYLPVGTDLAFYQSQVPKASLPLRTNYELGEVGIVPSQFRGILAAHEKAATTLQLKMFRPENLSRIEDTKLWTFSGSKFQQKADEIDIGNNRVTNSLSL